jgi:hypothetical protein
MITSERIIDICGTPNSRPQMQNKDKKAQIRRRRECYEGMALKSERRENISSDSISCN